MNLIDLIELAVLDALGMLEEDESAEFDAAFDAAPPATQLRVRDEQARLANLEGVLPAVSPSPEMRSRVISAVREAMLADAVAKASEADDDAPLSIRKSGGVSRGWRIGTIAAAAAAVAFGVAFGHSTLRYQDLNDRFEGKVALDSAVGAYGAEARDLLLRPHLAKNFYFTPVDPTSNVAVTLQHLDEKQLAYLNCEFLPTEENVEYALVTLDANGRIGRTIRQFASEGPLTRQRIEDITLDNGMRLALVSVNVATGMRQVMLDATIAI
ncbi:MAG: hypothetical protein NCW75_00750 [Phycisphaera sp.]|nr:MAG: hypothetical protein NCW75_00750 [Phycisphaera sp.]